MKHNVIKQETKEALNNLVETHMKVEDLIGGVDDPYEDLPSFLKKMHYNRKDDLQTMKL
jgi:hypothetical protein